MDNGSAKDKYTKVEDGRSLQADHTCQSNQNVAYAEKTAKNVLLEKLKKSVNEMTALFSHKEMRRRLFICHFAWMGTSLSYYAMGKDELINIHHLKTVN